MTIAYTLLVILLSVLVFMNTYRVWSVYDVRRQGKLPLNGKSTMFDVRRMLMEGQKDLAIRLYCEIFNTNLAKARKDIEELQRSLKKV